MLFKQSAEIMRIGITDASGNITDAADAGYEQMLRPLHAVLNEIIDRKQSGVLMK